MLSHVPVFYSSQVHTFVALMIPIVDFTPHREQSFASILHTIFFHRTLTLVRPKDVDCDLFEITYVQCGLADLEKEVDEKINQFIAWVEKHPNRRSQVCLSFFDEKNKNPGWFTNKTERIYWEQWFINLHVISPKGLGKSRSSKGTTDLGGQALEEARSKRAALGSLIQEVLFQIINFANEKKDHIPPISDRIFNHEIMIPRYKFLFTYLITLNIQLHTLR
ncbi:hypothetical protein GUJ93_ZPchr0012g19063 [Zizania palustris]|uniref:Autophagy-related protein 101 n=1 Tax=Zizania palustris TaxID=103762 RepID=A0A8J5WL76_ZIZPA|nr:hypothetical protein GUJ93_ZPchr0012g19063 [Zizania palustris]